MNCTRLWQRLLPVTFAGFTALCFAVADASHSGRNRRAEMLATQSFCGTLGKIIEKTLSESVSGQVSPAHILALENRLLKELRSETGASFIDVAAMTPEPPGVTGKPLASGTGQTVMPLARILGPAMGLGSSVLLAYTFDELKYLPFTQMGSHILLIATDNLISQAGLASERKFKLVSQTAQKLNVRISLLNLSSISTDSKQYEALTSLAASTGGTVVAIDSKDQGCGKLL